MAARFCSFQTRAIAVPARDSGAAKLTHAKSSAAKGARPDGAVERSNDSLDGRRSDLSPGVIVLLFMLKGRGVSARVPYTPNRS